LGAHGGYVERSAQIDRAIKRSPNCGKPAVVNVIADRDGTKCSEAWLRLKSGEMFSRGIDCIGLELRRQFQVSPVRTFRNRKSAEDNGTQIPLSFIVELRRDVDELTRLADASS
jgi:acetolactate synthase-1/2/3 large subunit